MWPACEVIPNQAAISYRYSGQSITYNPIVSGGDASKWSYSWKVDGNIVGSDASYTYTVPSHIGAAVKTSEIKVDLTNTPENIQSAYANSLTYALYCYDYPSVNALPYDAVLFVGQKTTLSLVTTGGKEGAWKYDWSIGGNADSCEFLATQAGDYTVTVTVKNLLGNDDTQYDYSTTLTYTIKVWPACEVKPGDNPNGNHCFEQQPYTFSPILIGGDSTKWTYEWYVNEQKVSTDKTYTYIAPDAQEEEKIVSNILLKLANAPDSISQPFLHQVNYQLVTWHMGSVSKQVSDREFYDGQTVEMSLNQHYGYPEGWTYKWTRQGDLTILSTRNLCQLLLGNTSEQMQKQIYQVEWQNAIAGNIGAQGVDTIILDVYPAISAPTFGNGDVIKIRDVDTLKVSLESGSGGNPSGWYYIWNDIDYTTDFSYDVYNPIDLSSKHTEHIFVEVYWQNRSPNGRQVWADGNAIQEVVVYNTPINPVLKSKGNGASNIFIVDELGMLEEELWNKEYNFRFWDGSTLVAEHNHQRWCRYDKTPQQAWAQSVWYYDDGFVCEGDIITASASYYIPSAKAAVSIYRIDGELVVQIAVDEIDTIENLYATLDAGIYIVKTESDGIVNTSKIVIR